MSRSIRFLSGIPEIAHTSAPTILLLPLSPFSFLSVTAPSVIKAWSSTVSVSQTQVNICSDAKFMLIPMLFKHKCPCIRPDFVALTLHCGPGCANIKLHTAFLRSVLNVNDNIVTCQIWTWILVETLHDVRSMWSLLENYSSVSSSMHLILGWTATRMHNNNSLNREFHQKNVLGFDVHLLFVLALTLLFPWSKCSLRARVHDLWWRVLGHELEALSTGLAKGQCNTRPASQPDGGMFSYTLLKEHFQAGLLAALDVRKK